MNISQVLRGHGVGVGKKSQGNAVAGDVLAGKTFTNSTGDVTGTMPNNGAVTLTPGASAVTIAAGFHSGTGTVSAVSNLAAGNIKATATVGGVAGAFTSDATIVANDVVSGKTGYKNGAIVTGTVPLHTSTNGNAGSNWHLASQVSPVDGTGVFLRNWPIDGSQTHAFNGDCWLEAADVDFNSGNWPNNVNIFGLQGTMPTYISDTAGTNYVGTAGRLYIRPPAGYWNNSAYTYYDDADFVASNIRSGVNMWGLTGSLVPGTAYASGVTTRIATGSGNAKISVRGLSFTPAYVLIDCDPISSSTNGVAGYIVSYGIPRNYYSNDSQFMYNNTDVGTGDNQFQIVAGGFDLICYAGSVNPDVFWRAWQGA